MADFIRIENQIFNVSNVDFVKIKQRDRIEIYIKSLEYPILITGDDNVSKFLSKLNMVVSDEEFKKYSDSTGDFK